MNANAIPKHIAIIMDGNGRWAKQRGLPRTAGHKKGAQVIREIAIACNALGVQYLTLYAFSTENWKRPEDEVNYLCKLPKFFFNSYMKELKENNIKVQFIGEIQRFPKETQIVIDHAVKETIENSGLNLCFAINYGGRQEIVSAAKNFAIDVMQNKRDLEISEIEFSNYLMSGSMPDVDLMIRTSGESRISNFLLWHNAYSEFIFTKTPWPEFSANELENAILEFQGRDRRYGGLK